MGHAQWVFTIPKMLRIYFLHHRELLGALSRAGYETVKELMAAAVEEKDLRPGMVSVVQTFGEGAKFHPHLHALCSRGGWTASGEWIPLPYVDEAAAEKLFRHKVLALLRRRGLLSQERIELLDSWRRSGFSVHNRVVVHPRDQREFFALVRYMMRPPVSLDRLHFTPGSHEVLYLPKAGHDDIQPTPGETIDAIEFVARVLVQIPAPKRHLVRYYGAYSNAARGKRKKAAVPAEPSSPDETPEDVAIPDEPHRAALRRSWAELIRRVYEVDPLVCPRCGAEMRVVGFITQPHVIKRILDHLRKRNPVARPPPHPPQPVACPARDPPLRRPGAVRRKERCRPGTRPRALPPSPTGHPRVGRPAPGDTALTPKPPLRRMPRASAARARKGKSYPPPGLPDPCDGQRHRANGQPARQQHGRHQ